MKVGMDKVENVANAVSHIRQAVADQKPKVVALPECFNSPYGTKYFNEYAETIPDGYTTTKLSEIAKELNIYLVGGTIPERDATDGKTLYNTCTVWSPSGNLIGKHRKVQRMYACKTLISVCSVCKPFLSKANLLHPTFFPSFHCLRKSF